MTRKERKRLDIALRQQGLVATTRKTRGDDIDAACGQLAGKVADRVKNRLGDKRIGSKGIGEKTNEIKEISMSSV